MKIQIGADPAISEKESLELAAQAWCGKKTSHKVMDVDLAFEFAGILYREMNLLKLRLVKEMGGTT